jgi:uroporphyrinogen-III decarboxylase
MNSKERMLAAIHFDDADYVPCSIYLNKRKATAPVVPGYDFRNSEEERIRLHLDLGLDTVINFPPIPNKFHREVRTRIWKESVEGQEHPVLFKEYQTPEGVLRRGIKQTPEWPHGDEIPFHASGWCAGHCWEPLLKTPDDLKALRYLMFPPDEEEVKPLREKIEHTRRLAEQYQILIRGKAGDGLKVFFDMMGAEHFIYFVMDYPDAFRELVDMDRRANLGRIKLNCELGAELLNRFGAYEMSETIAPELFRTVIRPSLTEEAELAHSYDTPMYYRVVTGMKPILKDIAETGMDCIEGLEPCLSACSNQDVYDAVGGKVCVWSGVSTPGHINNGTEEEVRNAVRNAMDVFGSRGFILGITNSIRNYMPWENVLAMVDEWKKCR